MRITESKLRSIIRSVIKESQMNEMFDMNFAYDSMAGAGAVSSLAEELMSIPISDFKSPRKKSHIENTLIEFLEDVSVTSTRGAYASALITPLMAYLAGCVGMPVLTASGITIGALVGLLMIGNASAKELARRLGIEEIDINIDGSVKAKISDFLSIESKDVETLKRSLDAKQKDKQ